MKRSFLLLIVVLSSVGLLGHAAGEIAWSVLDIDPGVRALGMGGAAVALGDGAETLYYNPAALAGVSGIAVNTLLSSQLGIGSYSAFSAVMRNVGIGYLTMNSGDIQGYDAGGNATGALAYSSGAFLLGFGVDPRTFGFALPMASSFGGRIKYITADNGGTTGSGFAVDVAAQFETNDMLLGPVAIGSPRFSVSATNILGTMGYDGRSEAFPMGLRFGAAAWISRMVLVAMDLDLAGGFHLGFEYPVVPTLAVRAGLKSQAGGISITVGVGLNVSGFVIDYALMTHALLSASHRVSLSLDFSTLDLTALTQSLRRLLP